MGTKRKQRELDASNSHHLRQKRVKHVKRSQPQNVNNFGSSLSRTLLPLYYSRVVSLRQFLLSKLPTSSKFRRRRIISYGLDLELTRNEPHFLDSTIVGVLRESSFAVDEERGRDFVAFTQSQLKSSRGSSGGSQIGHIAEIVDFVIWTLFHRSSTGSYRPQHLLCHGFQRLNDQRESYQEHSESCSVPGLCTQHPNENVKALKTTPWTDIMPLLGSDGNAVVRSLLLDCGLFIRLKGGMDNLYQLSGIPLTDLEIIQSPCPRSARIASSRPANSTEPTLEKHKPGRIVFVRSRMLYAKPALNAKGEIRFGMKHIHVFNRFSDHNNADHVVHNMKYVFPRHFGLHNVFTSVIDAKETIQPFKDYTLREHEIVTKTSFHVSPTEAVTREHRRPSLPRRLRGAAQTLIRKILRNHHFCPYTQLLRHYCAVVKLNPTTTPSQEEVQSLTSSEPSAALITHVSTGKSTISNLSVAPSGSSHGQYQPAVIDYASPAAHVSTFCQSVIRKLLPRDTFGLGMQGIENEKKIMASVDDFICMRRYESLSLHEVSQGIALSCIPWLRPPNVLAHANMSRSDRRKRVELLLEIIYYLFDSIIIPLVRSNFYVTESNTNRNQLFYFRHDIWRKISEPSLTLLKLKTFRELEPHTARKMLNSRSLGFSYIRLLPKANRVRPIINLRRRVRKSAGGRATLGKSINAQLSPVFDLLNYERTHQPSKLGSALFSVGEIHGRLCNFKNCFITPYTQPFFFVKVDVQNCFDTIPQDQLLELIKDLITSDRYRISKHAEVKPSDERWGVTDPKPSRKFVSAARPAGASGSFSPATVGELAQHRKRTVYTNTGSTRVWDTIQLVKLLQEHVQQNIIKIGKRHFRQKNGIPQGSVLSSLLCSFFYGDFENKHLGFLQHGGSLLLRLIDDFLLITTNQDHAKRFLQVMADGSGDYGITLNTSKSLANFEISVNGSKIPRLHGSSHFPYCGMLIGTRTLEVTKDRVRKEPRLANALTVEHSRRPGQNFKRKVLSSLKIQMQAIILDNSLNATALVAGTLFQNFAETAMKMHRYVMSLPRRKRPNESLIIEVFRELTKLAHNLTSGIRRTKWSQYTCSITVTQMLWLAATSFETVLVRKQTMYAKVLLLLRVLKDRSEPAMKLDKKAKSLIVEESRRVFRDHKF